MNATGVISGIGSPVSNGAKLWHQGLLCAITIP